MKTTYIAENLHILHGDTNVGVLQTGDRALLIDCCEQVTPDELAALGIHQVDRILCTQHRLPNVAGAYPFIATGSDLVVPETERALFDQVETHWNDWRNRWHVYHQQPGPQVIPRAILVSQTVGDGDRIEWEGWSIRVLETPGSTDGSISYLIESQDQRLCFSGDLIYAPGQLWDLYSLQKGFGIIGDYHGFMGNHKKLIASLSKVLDHAPALLLPSHGEPIEDPPSAVNLLIERLERLWRNYTATSCLNHYFPDLFEDTKDDPQRFVPAATATPPAWVERVAFTSFAVISEIGAALLIDCGHDSVVTTLRQWAGDHKITGVDACWVTHYHDDHVDGLGRLVTTFHCPLMTDRHLAEIIEHPVRFFLPCISPLSAPVAKATHDGESWTWNEFTLTAFHFPGQTFYHSGLLVEGHGQKVFFAGDSGAPTGIDDHCCGNRNFLGENRGFRRCIQIWRETQPDFIINEHQERAFSFTDGQLDYLDKMLAERERLTSELLPWDHPDFGLDEGWVRTYPYQQETCPGGRFTLEVLFTNHGPHAAEAEAEPLLPDNWTTDPASPRQTVQVPPHTSGSLEPASFPPDGAIRFVICAPPETPPGRHIIPFRIRWDGRRLGPIRHAIVLLRSQHPS